MTSPPPLSPTPRRWRSPQAEHHPDFAALLTSFENTSNTSHSRESSRTRDEPRDTSAFRLPESSPISRDGTAHVPPEIRTISPSPQRAQPSFQDLGHSGSSGQGVFGGQHGFTSESSLGQGTVRPGLEHTRADSFTSNHLATPHDIHPQTTGLSTTTLDAAYDGVFSQLDALANQGNPAYTAPAPAHRSGESSLAPPIPTSVTTPYHAPLITQPPIIPPRPFIGLGMRQNDGPSFMDDVSRLETVTERTEVSSLSPSMSGSPQPPEITTTTVHAQRTDPERGTTDTLSIQSIANRFPLPSSPIKGPRPAIPQTSPKKASDLIRLFESRAGGSDPVQLQIPPIQSQNTGRSTREPGAPLFVMPPRLESAFTPSAPPSSFHAPIVGSTPPPKSPSPLSQVRTMIASWRARPGSPSQRVVGSPNKGGDTPRLFGRDRGWNVSIRRRRRNEGEEALAEQGVEEAMNDTPAIEESMRLPSERGSEHGGDASQPSRAGSFRSQATSAQPSRVPRLLTGEPVKYGTVWYLNVHDPDILPDFIWIQADARLFNEGLQLTWRTSEGLQAMVTLDLGYCEEVASTYSPNNPMAGDDIGAAAARRQENLNENLYPFKLVYDDGTERLACESARDRVRWVNAIWSVLERTRGLPERDSVRPIRALSYTSSSDADGSAYTQYVPRPAAPAPGSSSDTGSVNFPSSPLPLFTTDDAVIQTSGGLVALVAHRGSRRLAAGGLERGRSLRRVASEADLSEAAGPFNLEETPLTTQAARSRPGSRDFAFAGGISPPPLISPPPRYMSPVLTQTFTAVDTVFTPSSYRSALQSTPAVTAQQFSSVESMYTAQSGTPVVTARGFTSTASMHTAQPSTAVVTAQEWSTPVSSHTAGQDTAVATALSPTLTPHTIPRLAITEASPSNSGQSMMTAREGDLSVYTTVQQTSTYGILPTQGSTVFGTAQETVYTSATGSLGSPFMTAEERETHRDSVSSYNTAPPPVPSRDSSSVATSREPSPTRYQLHDKPVPSYDAESKSTYSTAKPPTGFVTPASALTGTDYMTARRPPTTRMATADTYFSSYHSTPSQPSSYTTAPPPPISRSTTPGDYLSWRSQTQDNAETATQISEPDTDIALIADLERQSSAGSIWPRRRPVATRFVTADQGTVWGTAKETVYGTAQSNSTHMTTASAGTTEPYRSATSSLGLPPYSNPSTTQSEPSSRIRRVPVPSLPPPSPSGPPSSYNSTSTDTSSTDSHTPPDMLRILNYLVGQDSARSGQTTRISTQLDRIERGVGEITELMPGVRDRPPPVPSKDESPPSSPTSSTSTARPITPPPVILSDALAQRFDDMQRMLGTLMGRTDDIAQEQAKRRLSDEQGSGNPALRKIEDLLRRALLRIGDPDMMDGMEMDDRDRDYRPPKPPSSMSKGTPRSQYTRDGSIYGGSNAMYSEELNPKRRAPVHSFASSYDARKKTWSGVPSSLLDGSIPEMDFDEHMAMGDMPPNTPPEEYMVDRPRVPQHLANRLPRYQVPSLGEEYYDDDYKTEYASERAEEEPEPAPEPEQEPSEYETEPPQEDEGDRAPIPYRPEEEEEQEESVEYEEDPERGPSRRLPPPQPVDLPTPVRSDGGFPPMPPPQMPGQMGMGGSMPPFGGMPPPPPGMSQMPRPSLPRIAGVRDPISTTYFRRGFPPPGPMGMTGPMGMPMGMFPGPMGMPGPGMGPFMRGLRPGLNGFGGPLGPNVNPQLRRPGIFPPGVNGTTGSYGLPAAAGYGNVPTIRPSGLPTSRPPITPPDTGIGNTTSDSTTETTPSVTTAELVTPVTTHTHLDPHTTLPPTPHSAADTDDSFRRALENTQDMTAAQGDQQNEISRYLHGMSDQIADARDANRSELSGILGDIARLREELKPKHVLGHVLPDGRVVLQNGDIVDGVRGAPARGVPPAPLPAPGPPAIGHVKGKILPDGTVMVGDKLVDGIRAAPPAVPEPIILAPEAMKDMEQDRKLASLEDKIMELMNRTAPPAAKPVPIIAINEDEEEEAIPNMIPPHSTYVHEKTKIQTGDQPVAIPESTATGTVPLAANVPVTQPTLTAADIALPPSGPSSAGSGGQIRINPRTGKPIALPKPLSLSPRDPSPIKTITGDVPPGGQLIREEHEEIIQRPGGGPPVHTHTTTRTYQMPDGTIVPTRPVTLGDPANGTAPGSVVPTHGVPVDAYGDPIGVPGPNGTPPHGVPVDAYGDPAVPLSVIPPSAAAFAPGKQTSDHVAVSTAPRPQVPGTLSTHEDIVQQPGGIPVDTVNTSNVQTQRPAATVADPAGNGTGTVLGNVPGNGNGTVVPAGTVIGDAANGKPAKVKPVKSVWDTNHPKHQVPVTTSHNIGNDPTPVVVPAHTEADAPNAPTTIPVVADPKTAAPGPVIVHDGATPSVPAGGAVQEVPVDGAPASSKGGKNIRWDPRVPAKDVAEPAAKSTPSKTLQNIPDTDSTGGNKLHKPGSQTAQDAPLIETGHEHVGHPHNNVGNGQDTQVVESDGANPPAVVVPTDHEVNRKESTKGSGLLSKLKPSKSKENVKETHHAGPVIPTKDSSNVRIDTEGPPIVSAPGSGKSTRFSDTAEVAPTPLSAEERHAAEIGAGVAGPVIGEEVGKHKEKNKEETSNTLKKKNKNSQEADVESGGNTVLHDGGGSILDKMKGKGNPGRGDGIANVGDAPPLHMTEVLLPDGRTAYIPVNSSAPPAPGATIAEDGSTKNKKGKKGDTIIPAAGGEAVDTTTTTTTVRPYGRAGDMDRHHCAMCCPSAPRDGTGRPIFPCEHQYPGQAAPGAMDIVSKPASVAGGQAGGAKLTKGKPQPVPPVEALNAPLGDGETAVEQIATEKQTVTGGKLKKGGPSGAGVVAASPEDQLEDAKKLAAKQKAAAELAAQEKAARDQRDKEKADKLKLAEDRHKQNADALANLQKAIDALATDNKTQHTTYDERIKVQEKRRADKTARDKKITDALDKLVLERDEAKKQKTADAKKPGTQAILDALKAQGDAQAGFIRQFGTDIMKHNTDQHLATQAASKAGAREQVGFNLAGYLDDFSKALSGEVRVLLKEVGDLRESRRALYLELADLLLMKGRQSTMGDFQAILPYPAAPSKNPAAKKDEKKPEQPKGGGGGGQAKPAGGVPMWSTYIPPTAPVIGAPSRPLPTPTPVPMAVPINLIPGAVPPPPPPSGVSAFQLGAQPPHAVLKKNYQSRPMPQV